MADLATALNGLKDAVTSGQRAAAPELEGQLATALSRLAEAQLAGSQLIADETRRAHRPSNEVVPGISVFNRRGQLLADYQKPRLKCIMMVPWLVEWESCTREEVELLNLLQPGTYRVTRIDKSKVNLTIQIDYAVDQVTPSRLIMTHDTAFNNDNFKLVPDLTRMLREILLQHDPEIAMRAKKILTDEEEEALIEAGALSVSV